jgi:hypothetical protein
VRDGPIVVEHHPLHVLGHDRDLGIRAGKLADRIERTPARHHQELDAALERAAQDARVDEAIDPLELREGIASQVPDVLIGKLAPREPPPLSGDQAASS